MIFHNFCLKMFAHRFYAQISLHGNITNKMRKLEAQTGHLWSDEYNNLYILVILTSG